MAQLQLVTMATDEFQTNTWYRGRWSTAQSVISSVAFGGIGIAMGVAAPVSLVLRIYLMGVSATIAAVVAMRGPRSGIYTYIDGIKIRGLLRSRDLRWCEIGRFEPRGALPTLVVAVLEDGTRAVPIVGVPARGTMVWDARRSRTPLERLQAHLEWAKANYGSGTCEAQHLPR
jgi:hypothetical protein